ncbi:sigma 54-interacting transcriptional regulator [Bacillus sp. SL00103]
MAKTKEIAVDVRVIANMNEDPVDAIAGGRMRKDLFYRLGIVTLFIPPLSERKRDITFVNHFIQKYNELFQMKVKTADEEVLALFQAYDWPGNVRELEHVIEAGMNMMMDEDELSMHHLPYHFRFKQMEGRPPAQLTTNSLQQNRSLLTPLSIQALNKRLIFKPKWNDSKTIHRPLLRKNGR